MRIKDFLRGRYFDKCVISKDRIPRMAWRDVQVKLEGEVAFDLSRSFIQYWSFIKTDFSKAKEAQPIGFSKIKKEEIEERAEYRRQLTMNHKSATPAQPAFNKFKSEMKPFRKRNEFMSSFPSQAEPNAPQIAVIEEKPERDTIGDESHKAQNQNVFRMETILPTPSPDMGSGPKGRIFKSVQASAKEEMKDLLRELKNPKHLKSKREESSIKGNPEEIQLVDETSKNVVRQFEQEKKEEKNEVNNEQLSLFDKLRRMKNLGESDEYTFRKARITTSEGFNTISAQLIRSAGDWSLGLQSNKIENSIHLAYCELIDNAKHFIYIENQFFISSTAGNDIQNKIAEALVLRIRRAIEKGQNFMVVVVIPIMPGFEGSIQETNGIYTRLTFGFQQLTISRGPDSIMGLLREYTEHPEQYIKFYGLRRHAKMSDGKPVTEQVYVHSKMMVVDDNVVLIGSANINDRSMMGDRDSEMAVVLEDEAKTKALIGGQQVSVSHLVHSLRKRCFSQIFGLEEDEVRDAMSENMWRNIEVITKVVSCSS